VVSEPEGPGNLREIMKGPPSGYFIVIPDREDEAADGLAAFGAELLAAWKLLLAATVIGGLIAVTIALLLPPKYRARALVAPVTQQNGSTGGGALRELGGIAALAGIELGGGGRKEEYLATLTAPGLAREFIQAHNLLPILYADRWDPQAERWRAGAKVPTLGQAVRRFTDDVVSISDDRRTSVVTVTVDWYSPQLAAQWANGLIETVNDRLRADAIRTAQSSLEYLDKELAKTNVIEIRQAIYRLVEEQVSNAMLANVQREYAYRFIDAAVAPDQRYSPKRAVMGAVGAAVGLFLGVVVVYVRRAAGRRRGRAATRLTSDGT
jgi:capsular polysaccharide biosynthesis protein